MLGRSSFELPNVSIVQPDFDVATARQYNQAPIGAFDPQISDACNQVCPNCWGPTHHRRPTSQAAEMRPAEDWQQLFVDLNNYASRTIRQLPDGTTEPAPLPRVIFTGAEPLQSEVFIPALRTARSLPNLGRITVSSNCITNTPETATRFDEMLGLLVPGQDEVAAPIEGSTDAIVEMVRPGSTALNARGYALSGGRRAQAAGLFFKPRTVVTDKNAHDLQNIPPSMREAGIDLASVPKWKCGQPQPPASKYEQTANWPNADEWAKEWGISPERVLSAVIGAAVLNPELKTEVQLYANTTGRYNLQIDPYGVAYTLVINRDGLPKEVVFGDIMSDFAETMRRYNLFAALTFGIQSTGQTLLGDQQDANSSTRLLSAVLAEGYEAITPSWLDGYNMHALPTADRMPRLPERIASPAELEVTFEHSNSKQIAQTRWQTNLSQLAEGGLEHVTLGLGWEADKTHQNILVVTESLPGIRLNFTSNANSNKLDQLMSQRKIDRVIVPIEITSQLSGGRLETATQDIVGRGQSQAIALIQRALELGQKITIQINVNEHNFALIPQLPSTLYHLLGAPTNNMVAIELIENEPLQHRDKQRQNFEHDGLTGLAQDLRMQGCSEVQVKPWAYIPGRRFNIQADGTVCSDEIAADGKVVQYVYGNVAKDKIADLLAKRQRHARSVADRLRQIRNLDMPHGYKDSILNQVNSDSATVLTVSDPQRILEGQLRSDALARYYHGIRVQNRIASLALG